MNLQAHHNTLYDLGWRLRHHLAARDSDPDHVANIVGISADIFALALTGHYELPFSTLCAILDHLELEWTDLFGTEIARPRKHHHLTVSSDAWHAIDGEIQRFDMRRDVERFRAGDWLWLWEKRPDNTRGRVLIMHVTYILYSASVDLPAGYVVMAIERVVPLRPGER